VVVGGGVVSALKTRCRGDKKPTEIRKWAEKWGPLFGCPVPTVMTISQIESGYRPDCVNYDLRAIPLGGAWGPLQMTQTTANDWARKLSTSRNASVRAVAGRWKGNGEILTRDLELAVLLSTAMLGALTKEFGTFTRVAAAYHQGAGKVRAMIKAGQAIPAELPPKGKAYVAMALKAEKAVTA
jgi:Transglycosylase SLT domain